MTALEHDVMDGGSFVGVEGLHDGKKKGSAELGAPLTQDYTAQQQLSSACRACRACPAVHLALNGFVCVHNFACSCKLNPRQICWRVPEAHVYSNFQALRQLSTTLTGASLIPMLYGGHPSAPAQGMHRV